MSRAQPQERSEPPRAVFNMHSNEYPGSSSSRKHQQQQQPVRRRETECFLVTRLKGWLWVKLDGRTCCFHSWRHKQRKYKNKETHHPHQQLSQLELFCIFLRCCSNIHILPACLCFCVSCCQTTRMTRISCTRLITCSLSPALRLRETRKELETFREFPTG